jgi:hypothetical protein
MRKAIRYGLASMLTAGLLGAGMSAAPAAFASGGGGGVIKEGSCSASSTWKLKAQPDNGRIEVDFEVDQNVIGDTWKVKLLDNGVRFFRGQRVTQAPSGSFEVRKFTANQPGTDKIKGSATNLSTGETCVGAVSL